MCWVDMGHTKKLHFCFLAAKCYGIDSFPLETVHLFEPILERSGNETVPLIFIAFILNPCSRIQHIAVVYDLTFQITNLSTHNFSKMQPGFELRLYAKIFEVIFAMLKQVFLEHEKGLQAI